MEKRKFAKYHHLLKNDPKIFYMLYIVKTDQSELPRFEDMIVSEESLRELLNYHFIYGSRKDKEHQYNLTKNTFWNKSGFNTMLGRELGL